MQGINKDLISYIDKNIFPYYQSNDSGHRIEHIRYVIDRSFQLSKSLNINSDMVYAIATYHDCGRHIDDANHNIVSAQIAREDKNLRKFFSEEEITVIAEAIEDHRANLDREPRSLYGKIVSSADRDSDVPTLFRRIHGYALARFPSYTPEQRIGWAYAYTKEKFGPNGYAKMYLADEQYEDFLRDIKELTSDKSEFDKKFKEINNLN
jgi:uncharacterized protein